MIKFKEEDNKKKLFLNLNKLREHKGGFEGVIISHDMTDEQRKEHKRMIQRANEMNLDLSGNFRYRVRGPPWNMRIAKVNQQAQA